MIKTYHRVKTLQEALDLMARPTVNTVILYGYDAQVDEAVEEVVDLQAIGLTQIRIEGDDAFIGGMVSLQTAVDSPHLPDTLRNIMQQEDSSTFRNMRTLAHVLNHPDSESVLLAALLAMGASIRVATEHGEITCDVATYLASPVGIPLFITVPLVGVTAQAQVARTPADKPIVAAVAFQAPAGTPRLALCGVAPLPILVDLSMLDDLTPPADFRGNAAYRKDMAIVLSHRVLHQIAVSDRLSSDART